MLEEPLVVETRSWKPWMSTIAKILVVLLFPIGVGINFGNFYWASALLQIGIPGFTLVVTLQIAAFSVLIMLPGIFFERRIKSKPITESIRKMAVVSILITWLVPLVSSLSIPPMIAVITNPVFIVPNFFMPLLSISFFIILPILDREFILRHTPEQFQYRKYPQLSRDLKNYVGKSRYLFMLIWTGLLFSPIISIGYWTDTLIDSVLFTVEISSGGVWLDFMSLVISFSIRSTTTIHAAFLIFSLRFIFVRDLFRFNEGNITRSRLISMGILSEIAPVAILTLVQFMTYLVFGFPFEFYSWILPTPIFPILGYVYVRMSRNLSSAIILWDTEEHRMWFDTDTIQAPDQQPKDLGIKVPITYLIRSRLLKRMRR
ncbi:MAG: hypothetical protein ACW98U_09130 [Candidatus Thorarchaeota archaeon]